MSTAFSWNNLYDPLIILLIICTYTDLRFRRIPNRVVYPAMLLALGYHTVTGGLGGLGWSMQGLLAGAALLFIPFLLGGMGAGDVKLLAAIGAWKGPPFVLLAFLYSALCGGVWALILIIISGRYRSYLALIYGRVRFYLPPVLLSLLNRRLIISTSGCDSSAVLPENQVPIKSLTMPYGAAITLGTLLALIFFSGTPL